VVALKSYAAHLKGVALPVLLPGITLNTSATDYRPIKDGYMSNSATGNSWSTASCCMGMEGGSARTLQRGRSRVPPHARRGRVARGANKEDRDAV
jgi:hypothetical protein